MSLPEASTPSAAAAPDLALSPQSDRAQRTFALVVWVLMMLAAFYLVATYSSDVPYQDYWEMIPALAGHEAITPSWLWEAHNEHRIPLPKLTLLALHWLTRNDFRAGMIVNVVLLGGLALAMMRAARTERGRGAFADAFFPLLLLHWGHCENFLWSWQIGFILSTTLAGVFLLVIVMRGNRITRQAGSVAGICLILLPLCGANGLILVPPLAMWLVASAILEWRKSSRSAFLAVLVLAVASLVLTGLYFVNYQNPPARSAHPDLEQWLRTALQYLSMGFGLFSLSYWRWWAIAGCGLLLATAFVLTGSLIRRPQERMRAAGLLAFLAAMLSLALAIGWGRGTVGELGGGAFRYVSLAAPWLCACFFAFLLYAPEGMRRLAQNALLACSLLMFWPSSQYGLYYAEHQRALFASFQKDVLDGVPIPFLADRYSHFPSQIYPDPQRFAELLTMLREMNLANFQSLRDSPSLKALPLAEDSWVSGKEQVYVFKRPPAAVALRLNCAFQKSTHQALAQIRWQYHAAGDPTRIQNGSQLLEFTQATEQTVTIYVDGVINQFQFQLGPGFQEFRVAAIELLVPA